MTRSKRCELKDRVRGGKWERGTFLFVLSILSVVQLEACCLLPFCPTTCFPEGTHSGGAGSGGFLGGQMLPFAWDLTQRAGSWWWLLKEEEKALKSPAEELLTARRIILVLFAWHGFVVINLEVEGIIVRKQTAAIVLNTSCSLKLA